MAGTQQNIQQLLSKLHALKSLHNTDQNSEQSLATLSSEIINLLEELAVSNDKHSKDYINEFTLTTEDSPNAVKLRVSDQQNNIYAYVMHLVCKSDFKNSEQVSAIFKATLKNYANLEHNEQIKLLQKMTATIDTVFIERDKADKKKVKKLKFDKFTFVDRKVSDEINYYSTDLLQAAKAARDKADTQYGIVQEQLRLQRLAVADADQDLAAFVQKNPQVNNQDYQRLLAAHLAANKQNRLLEEQYIKLKTELDKSNGVVDAASDVKIDFMKVPLDMVTAMTKDQVHQKIQLDYQETVVRVEKLYQEQKVLVEAAEQPVKQIEAQIAQLRSQRIQNRLGDTNSQDAALNTEEDDLIDSLMEPRAKLIAAKQKLALVTESVERIDLIKQAQEATVARAEEQKQLDASNKLRAEQRGKDAKPSIMLAQLNLPVGAIEDNTKQIIKEIKAAHAKGIKTILFPEMAITGYLAGDFLQHEEFLIRADKALEEIKAEVEKLDGITVHVGHPQRDVGREVKEGKYVTKLFNAVSIISKGNHQKHYKTTLAVESVFDEGRYFERFQEPDYLKVYDRIPLALRLNPGLQDLADKLHAESRRIPTIVQHEGEWVWLRCCEEVWHDSDQLELDFVKASGARAVFVINGSPYAEQKFQGRRDQITNRIKETGLPHVYVNLGGSHVDLCYGGGSFVANAVKGADGSYSAEFEQAAPHFEDGCYAVHMQNEKGQALKFAAENRYVEMLGDGYQAYRNFAALVKATKDHYRKAGLGHGILGLSGGADSALTVAILQAALGGKNVTAFSLPSIYTDMMSNVDAALQCKLLDVNYEMIFIDKVDDAVIRAIKPFTEKFKAWCKEQSEIIGKAEGEKQAKAYLDAQKLANPSPDEATAAAWKLEAEKIQAAAAKKRAAEYMAWREGAEKLALENKGACIRQHIFLHYYSALMSAGNMATSNKAEVVTGYYTYKDMWGALAIIGDASKEAVYAMLAELHPTLPWQVIVREPSAELARGQKDQDSLPPYPIVDEIIRLYFDDQMSPVDIALYMNHAWKDRSKYICDLTMVNKVIKTSQVCRFKQIVGTNIVALSASSQSNGARQPVTSGYNNLVALKKLKETMEELNRKLFDPNVHENDPRLLELRELAKQHMADVGMEPVMSDAELEQRISNGPTTTSSRQEAVNKLKASPRAKDLVERQILQENLDRALKHLNSFDAKLLSYNTVLGAVGDEVKEDSYKLTAQEREQKVLAKQAYARYDYCFTQLLEHVWKEKEAELRTSPELQKIAKNEKQVNLQLQKAREKFVRELLQKPQNRVMRFVTESVKHVSAVLYVNAQRQSGGSVHRTNNNNVNNNNNTSGGFFACFKGKKQNTVMPTQLIQQPQQQDNTASSSRTGGGFMKRFKKAVNIK